jgi:putative redox protein
MSAIEITLGEGVQLTAKAPLATNLVNADVSKGMGGAGADMSCTDLFAVSLGGCMLTMMGLTARKLKLDLRGAKAEVTKTMVLQPELKFTGFHIVIKVPHSFDAETVAKLEDAARHCPVHTAVHPDIKQEVKFEWGA